MTNCTYFAKVFASRSKFGLIFGGDGAASGMCPHLILKDQLEECEEQSALVTKELREKSRDYELLKRSHEETQRAVQLLQVLYSKITSF